MSTSNADFLYTLSARLDGEVTQVFAQFETHGRRAGESVSRAVGDVGRAADQSSDKLRLAAAAARLFEGGIGGVASRLIGLNEVLRIAGGLIGGPLALIAAGAAFLNYGSTIQSAEARLRAMTGSQYEFNKAQAAAIEIAKQSRSSLTDTIALYSRLATVIPRQGIKLSEINPVVSAIQTTSAVQGLTGSQEQGALTNIAEIFDANAQRIGQQITRLSKDSPLLLQTIVDGLKKIDSVKFDGTVDQFRKLSAAGKTSSADLVHALAAEEKHLQDLLAAGGTTISQAKNAFSTAIAELIIKFESTTGALNGGAQAIVYLAHHLTELGGVLVVVGTALGASLVLPMLAALPAIVGATLSIGGMVLGFQGLLPALATAALGISEARIGLVALLSKINPVTAALTIAAGAIYYFATRESEADKAARDLGISQQELKEKVAEATGAIRNQNAALGANIELTSARGRADAKDKINAATDDEQKARDNLRRRLNLGALFNPAAGADLKLLANQVDAGAPLDKIRKSLDVIQEKFPQAFKGDTLKAINGDINAVADNLYNATVRVKGLKDQYQDLITTAGASNSAFLIPRRSVAETAAPKSLAELRAQADVNALDTETNAKAAAAARRRLALAQLDETFVVKGKVDPEKQDDYVAQQAQIKATYNQEIEGIKSTADAKRTAAKEERERKRAAHQEDTVNFKLLADAGKAMTEIDKANNEEKNKASKTFEAIKKATSSETRRDEALDTLQTDNLRAYLAGAQTLGIYMQRNAALEEEYNKALRQSNAETLLLAATDNLVLAGNSDAAEVLRRAVRLRHEGVDLANIDLNLINKQVIAEGERATALRTNNELVDVYARQAGDIQRAFRDVFAGGSAGNFLKSLQTSLRNSVADSLSIKIFGNAEQDARDRMTGAIGANSVALEAVRQALIENADALRNPAALGEAFGQGLTDASGRLASSPLSGANDNGPGLPNVDNPNVAAAQSSHLFAGAGILGAGFSLFASSNDKLFSSLSAVSSSLNGGGSGSQNPNLPRNANANFADSLSRNLGKIGDSIDTALGTNINHDRKKGEDGKPVADSGIFNQAGAILGDAYAGYQQGKQITSALESIGIGKNNTGAKVGGGVGAGIGAAATAITGIPGLAIVGEVAGALIGSLFGGVNTRAFTQLSVDAFGTAIAGSNRARGDKAAENTASSKQEASGFTTALNSLASAFGGTLKASSELGEIGVYGGKFGFHKQFGDGGGEVETFATAAEAVAAAIKNAINVGAVEGLRDGTKRLLTAAGDFAAQTSKAQKFESVFTDLKAATDPVGAAIDTVNKKFKDLKNVFGEAGASASDYASLQQLYDLQRADALKAAEGKTVTVLKDYLTSLQTNSATGLSARDREAAALVAFNPLADQITAGTAVNQDKFKAAADTLLAVDRELFGSTNDYFTRLTQITSLTSKAIDNATTGATAQTPADAATLSLSPAANAAPITDSLSGLRASLLAQGDDTNKLLAEIVSNTANNNYESLGSGGQLRSAGGGKSQNF